MDRSELSLENEIVNHFTHLLDTENPAGALKAVPGIVKRIIKELSTLHWTRGQLTALEQLAKEGVTLSDKKLGEMDELRKFVKEKEEELKNRYRIDEIKGT
jgi:hypothetical protein